MNAPHAPQPNPELTRLIETLTSQYREAITPVLDHHLAAMTHNPNALQYIELQDISEHVYLVKPIFIEPKDTGLDRTFVVLLTGKPIRDPNCYFLTYERKGVYDPAYAMPFLLRLFTHHPDKSILEQQRKSLLDVFEIEIHRQLKHLLGDKIKDPSVSGLMYVSILPIDSASIEQLRVDQAKEKDHV
jgi:hypothetical protein